MSNTQNKAFEGLKTIGLIVFGLLWYFFFSDGCENSGLSFSKKDCTFCDGKGKIECATCSGVGKISCSYCNGEGYEKCSACGGSAKRYQYGYEWVTVNGRQQYKYVYSLAPCKDCDRTGKKKCKNYDCNGTGEVKCTLCYAKGEKSCSYCNGTGKE